MLAFSCAFCRFGRHNPFDTVVHPSMRDCSQLCHIKSSKGLTIRPARPWFRESSRMMMMAAVSLLRRCSWPSLLRSPVQQLYLSTRNRLLLTQSHRRPSAAEELSCLVVSEAEQKVTRLSLSFDPHSRQWLSFRLACYYYVRNGRSQLSLLRRTITSASRSNGKTHREMSRDWAHVAASPRAFPP